MIPLNMRDSYFHFTMVIATTPLILLLLFYWAIQFAVFAIYIKVLASYFAICAIKTANQFQIPLLANILSKRHIFMVYLPYNTPRIPLTRPSLHHRFKIALCARAHFEQ